MLAALRPQKNKLVFDLAEQAGFDVSDWVASSNDPRGYKANPKYCYEWSFIEPGTVAILNLWFAAMIVEDGVIKQRGNFRQDAVSYGGPAGKPQWRLRATRLDAALRTVALENLAVRVIILDGKQRDKTDPLLSSKSSRVTARELDTELWTLTEYDIVSGQFELSRGILSQKYVDQFDLEQLLKIGSGKVARTTSAYFRDRKFRTATLARANGKCELCGTVGFTMDGGAIYLETHHIVPLGEGGIDHSSNMLALCPNDHRRAHYDLDRNKIREDLLRISSRFAHRKPN
jgi:5-methylcytosine-specific restriction protein A